MDIDFVCLKCHHGWTGRVEHPKHRQCPRCFNRHVVEYSEFLEMVEDVRRNIEEIEEPSSFTDTLDVLVPIRNLSLKTGLNVEDLLDLERRIIEIATGRTKLEEFVS